MEKMYIVKEGMAITTLNRVIGHPKNPDNPKQKEIFTAKDIKTGQSGIDKLLKSQNCPIVKYEKKETKKVETEEVENKEVENKPKGAEKK